jgi:hypothetical protein
MYVIYTVNLKNSKVTLLTFTDTYDMALDAVDQYSSAFLAKKIGGKAEEDVKGCLLPTDIPDKDGYYIQYNGKHKNIGDDSERIDLLKITDSKLKVLRYFCIGLVEKYIEDYLQEKTQAVIDLQNDASINVPLNLLDAADDSELEAEENSDDDE